MKRLLFLALGLILILCTDAFAATPQVRVLIVQDQKEIKLTVKGQYVVRSLPALQVLKKGERMIQVPLVASTTGMRLGKDEWSVTGIRVEPQTDRDLFVNQSRFRGTVDVLKNGAGLLRAINRLDIEGYLYGVLHHEVASWWPMEALKAQAVAARTYALYQVLVSSTQEFDLKSDTSSQVYGGSTIERHRCKRAVDETRGKVLVYQGKIFPTYFHATCAGITAGSQELWKIDIPPLSGKVRCNFCWFSPHRNWRAQIPLADIEEKMNKVGRPIGQILKIEVISVTPSGRVGSLRLTGNAGEFVMAAKDFRIWVGGDKIRSTHFRITTKDDFADFHGRGWGHGVGLCQWGTLGQALLGHPYEEILKLYYPGAEIATSS